jgi:5-methyltetrahydrofolate--homocysteine methyltransferase
VVEGSKVGLEDDLAAALADPRWPDPLAVINGPLMDGMGEVGRLFNDNQLIVAEVLQSAEVMKAAVSFLEPHMDRAESTSRGKVVIATVKGDVHDIGKNLVDIILTNNGFEVINLGIKVASERLVDAVREHRPDVLALSGLLVKSAQQMVTSAGDLSAAGVAVPLVVGGAALSRRYTHKKIAPAYEGGLCTYAKDAMHALELVERLTDPARSPALADEVAATQRRDREDDTGTGGAAAAGGATDSPPRPAVEISRDLPAPPPPDLDRHVVEVPPDEVWPYVNLQMLFGRHLGFRGSVKKAAAAGDPKLARLEEVLAEVQEVGRDGAMPVRAVWRFFPAEVEGQRLALTDPDGLAAGERRVAAAWELPRQDRPGGLSLVDFVLPGEASSGDHVALFVTTAGAGVRERVEEWMRRGEYLKAHAFAALTLETAEAAAEWLHARLRAEWGFPDPPETTMEDRFAARYRGKRYSFGYPACPDLGGQEALFAALRPEEIGVELTEGHMMEPEASVSALVFHHPEARYFGV